MRRWFDEQYMLTVLPWCKNAPHLLSNNIFLSEFLKPLNEYFLDGLHSFPYLWEGIQNVWGWRNNECNDYSAIDEVKAAF